MKGLRLNQSKERRLYSSGLLHGGWKLGADAMDTPDEVGSESNLISPVSKFCLPFKIRLVGLSKWEHKTARHFGAICDD